MDPNNVLRVRVHVLTNWRLSHSELIQSQSQSQSHFALAVYRQSIYLSPSPLRTTTRDFFQLNSCGNSPYVTSSLTRRLVCLL
jgi:hypothetical protein